MPLNRDQILAASDLKTESVSVPEWGGDVVVRTMTGTERDAWETALVRDGKVTVENIRARLVAMTAVGDDGERLFADSDIAALGKKSAQALDRVFEVAQRLNRLTSRDVDELSKNSVPSPSDGSYSV